MIFIDTNYWIRYLVDENTKQGQAACQLFIKSAKGECQLFSDVIVFFEIYWVVRNVYDKGGTELQSLLLNVVSIGCVKWEHKDILAAAVMLMSDLNYDLEDAYHLAWAKFNDIEKLASFDQKLQKVWETLS